jgi:flagellar protein FlbT
MALKVELKPNERIIIGTAVIRNGEARTRLFIEGEAPILREKDVMTAATADTPAKKIYLALQLMYLEEDLATSEKVYFPLVREFLEAAPSALPLIDEMNTLVLNGESYKALKAAKGLVAYEKDLIANAARGSQRLRGGSEARAAAP